MNECTNKWNSKSLSQNLFKKRNALDILTDCLSEGSTLTTQNVINAFYSPFS